MVFGPFYPPRLQSAVRHAERLAAVLSAIEASPPADAGEGFVAWIVGRHDEIEQFVGQVVEDWKRNPSLEDPAAAAIDAYLAELHDGFTLLGLGLPTCCVGSIADTVPWDHGDTREVNLAPRQSVGHIDVDPIPKVREFGVTSHGSLVSKQAFRTLP